MDAWETRLKLERYEPGQSLLRILVAAETEIEYLFRNIKPG